MRHDYKKANSGRKAALTFFIGSLMCFIPACQTVKPYQRVYLNDENMQAGKQPIKIYNDQVHAYREGASGGGHGKSSGGCGCN